MSSGTPSATCGAPAGERNRDLMVLGGWKSRAMLDRYGGSAAVERTKGGTPPFQPGRPRVGGSSTASPQSMGCAADAVAIHTMALPSSRYVCLAEFGGTPSVS